MEDTSKNKTFSSFDEIEEVCDIFGYTVQPGYFIQEKEYVLNEYFEKTLRADFFDMKNFVNEFTICESIIRPILADVARNNDLPLFSHIKLEYDKKLGLTGEPDYFLAPTLEKGGKKYTTPVVCVGEAKRDNFVKGWAQVGAEMIAAQKLNANEEVPIYGLVSTGKIWEFGILQNKKIIIDTNAHAAPANLNKVLNTLNWVFSEARKNVDILKKS